MPSPDASATDPVILAIDELLRVARENMSNWLSVMERTELIREQRRQGIPYTQMKVDVEGPPIIDVVSRNQERLTAAAAEFRRALAHALVEEGLSHADVARLFGVSRQRVGMLLRTGGTDDPTGAESTRVDAATGIADQTPSDERVRAETDPVDPSE